jgi:hypothetical protein
MSTITILDNEFLKLVYHEETKIVHHTFHQTVRGEEFRSALNAGLEVFKKYGAHKWLSDDRNNSALPEDDTHWAKTIWFPQVLAAGWQYWAIVWPPQTMAIMNLKEFMDSYRPFGLKVMAFKEPTLAMSWLAHNKAVPKIKLPVSSK